MAKSALPDPPPKETSSLDLHKQERSNLADTTNIDGVCTVCSHTHSIITSSNARAWPAVQNCESMGLLSGVVFCKFVVILLDSVLNQSA